MPHIRISTSSGPIDFRYTITTPNSLSATEVVENLPTILFLHSGYLAQEVFEGKISCLRAECRVCSGPYSIAQFADSRLRQFNLVAFDMRGYGETYGYIGNVRYTPTESAADVAKLMVNDL